MTTLLVNFTPEVDDPRVEVYATRDTAVAAARLIPGRVSFLLEKEDDLLGLAINGPKAADGTTPRLGGPGFVKIHNAFACKPVCRFESRTVGAVKTGKLLLSKFTEVKKMSEVKEHETETHTEDDEGPHWTPAAGNRVTLVADKARDIPEEHGVIIEVVGDMVTVEVDPLYRTGADDDGRRDVELKELAPDPVGVMRQKAEDQAKSKKQVKAEMRAQKAKEREEAKAAKAAAKAAKTGKTVTRGATVTRGSLGERKDKPITILAETNPKREGSGAHARFQLYRNGMTVQEALTAGMSTGNVVHDEEMGYIKIG